MCLSQQIQKPTVFPVNRDSFPKTTAFFDWGNYIIQRTGELVWNGKILIFSFAFMLFLIYELAHFAKFLMHNWHGG
jgi:hypothetical protein